MKNFTKVLLFSVALFMVSFSPHNAEFCGVRNTAFKAGERSR